MHIRASIRPQGLLKRGVRTEAYYKAMGFKGEHGPDIRDVVGTLTLVASGPQDTLFLAQLNKTLSDCDGSKMVITDKHGKEIVSAGSNASPVKKSKAKNKSVAP